MNLTILTGRITKDAELSSIGVNNTPKARFSLAVERAYQKDKDNKVVDYVDMEILGARAKSLASYLTKGKAVLVHGELNIDKYQNKNNETRYATKVKVDRLEFLSSNNNQPVVNNNIENQPVVNNLDVPKVEFLDLDTKSTINEPLNDEDIPF